MASNWLVLTVAALFLATPLSSPSYLVSAFRLTFTEHDADVLAARAAALEHNSTVLAQALRRVTAELDGLRAAHGEATVTAIMLQRRMDTLEAQMLNCAFWRWKEGGGEGG